MSNRHVERDGNRSGVINDDGMSFPPASTGRSTALATWRRAMLAVVGVAGLVAVVGTVSTEQAGAAVSPAASCTAITQPPAATTGPTTPAPVSTATASASDSTYTRVRVVVPSVVFVVLSADANPIAVETNTGRAPSCADLYLVAAGTDDMSNPHLATLRQVNQVMSLRAAETGGWAAAWHTL
jgi:hypothetical protein